VAHTSTITGSNSTSTHTGVNSVPVSHSKPFGAPSKSNLNSDLFQLTDTSSPEAKMLHELEVWFSMVFICMYICIEYSVVLCVYV
jgi:hypothetical protein